LVEKSDSAPPADHGRVAVPPDACGEIAEALFAMMSDGGDVASRDAGHDPEHGCTELVHHCSCHASCSAEAHEIVLAFVPPARWRGGHFVLTSPLGEPDPQALLRPPAA
jgi:hypothetical protein